MRLRRALAVTAIGTGLLFGCANPGYDRDATQDDLVDVGLTQEQARCVTRGLESEIGINALNTHTVPDDAEFQAAVAVLEGCGVDVSSDADGSS